MTTSIPVIAMDLETLLCYLSLTYVLVKSLSLAAALGETKFIKIMSLNLAPLWLTLSRVQQNKFLW